MLTSYAKQAGHLNSSTGYRKNVSRNTSSTASCVTSWRTVVH